METPLVELKSVTKYFGSVIALKDVSFDVRAGEVHCLLGDNGAGKSTLIKVLSGVHTPDEGDADFLRGQWRVSGARALPPLSLAISCSRSTNSLPPAMRLRS